MATQLLWLEGKAFLITRPQNSNLFSGHILYQGSAPVFITCKEKDLAPIISSARAAQAAGQPSDASMILRRLKIFHFQVGLPIQPGTNVPECGCCFVRMVAEHTRASPP